MTDVKDRLRQIKKIEFYLETGKKLFDIDIMWNYSDYPECPKVSDERTYKFAVDGINPLDFSFIGCHESAKNPLMARPCNACTQLKYKGVFNEDNDIKSIQKYDCIKYGGSRLAVGLANGKKVKFSKEQLIKLLEEKNTNVF